MLVGLDPATVPTPSFPKVDSALLSVVREAAALQADLPGAPAPAALRATAARLADGVAGTLQGAELLGGPAALGRGLEGALEEEGAVARGQDATLPPVRAAAATAAGAVCGEPGAGVAGDARLVFSRGADAIRAVKAAKAVEAAKAQHAPTRKR